MEKRNELENIIKDLKHKYLSLWWKTNTVSYFFEKEIKVIEKLRNERKIEKYRKNLSRELHKIPEDESDIKEWNNRIFSLIRDIEVNITGEKESYINFFVERGYSLITEEFIKEVRSFDTDMDVYDIFQAIRNVWIMNSIQVFFNMEVKLTPSIFSYSMLYPYSDNYLDDKEITDEDKNSLNNKFGKWLSGEEAKASNANEEKIYQLVKKIETEFPRERYPQVFESLLAIHTGQEKSLTQQRAESLPYEKDIIGISFEKGGTSVLADGYLVKGDLTIEEADFMFGYGVFLQIIDDLQDIEEDMINGHMTILSQVAKKWPLDNLVNKLLWFIDIAVSDTKTFLSEDSIKLKKVIQKSCIIMIFEAVSKNKKRFSKKYIKELEKYSILRFSYYKKLKRKFQKEFSSKDIFDICTILSKGYDAKKTEVI